MKNGYREATFKLLASSYSYIRLVASARKKFLEASAQKPPQRGNEIFEKTKLSSRNLRKAPNRIKKEGRTCNTKNANTKLTRQSSSIQPEQHHASFGI
jgi:hypothetical protein